MSFWDQRYSQEKYVYGVEPNRYLESKLGSLPVGKALFIAEGEGRNAVYAARLGWDVMAFDTSKIGKNKAEALAEMNSVKIDYRVIGFEDVTYEQESFDLIVYAYTHFPENLRRQYFKKSIQWLKPGGSIILEGFTKNHINHQAQNPKAGGPRNMDMLFSLEDLKNDFSGFDWLEALETETTLSEGEGHDGLSSVVRLFGKKKI